MSDNSELAIADGETLKGLLPEGLDWGMDIPPRTLLDMLSNSVAKYGDRPCFDFKGKKFTYKEFNALVDRAAKGLQQQGVVKGSKVGLIMPNSTYYPVMMFAILKAGGTVVNFDPTYDESKLKYMVADSGAEIMVTLDLKKEGIYSKVDKLHQEGVFKTLVACPLGDMMPTLLSAGLYVFKDICMPVPRRNGVMLFRDLITNDGKFKPVKVEPQDSAFLQYTSGSSGPAKGCDLTHANLEANSAQIAAHFGVTKGRPTDNRLLNLGGERILGALPLFHVFMLQLMLSGMRMGAETTLIINPKDDADVFKALKKKKITVMCGVPALFGRMLTSEHMKNFKKGFVKAIISGGAYLPANVRQATESAFGAQILEGFGSSETSPVVGAESPVQESSEPRGWFTPLPGTKIRITNPEDPSQTLGHGKVGELLASGPQVMRGYFNKAAATAKATYVDQNGVSWYRFGDLARMDVRGRFAIAGRLGRSFKNNGFMVSPEEVEEKIAKAYGSAIAQCIVVGVADEKAGKVPEAHIFFDPAKVTAKPSAKEIRDFLASKIEKTTDRPRHIVIWEKPLPVNNMNKPDFKAVEKVSEERWSKSAAAAPQNKP